MNIVILCYCFLNRFRRGGELITSELASDLSKNGNSVYVIGNRKDKTVPARPYKYSGTPNFCGDLLSTILHILVSPIILLRIHLSNKIDVIHVAGVKDLFAVIPIKLIFRVPVVLRLSTWSHAGIIKKLKRIVSLADVIVSLNEVMRHLIIEAGFDENKITLIPNGVDISQFKPSQICFTNNRRAVILWAGSLDPHKQPSWAIEVLSYLKAANRNVSLKIIGDGYMRKQLQNEVTKRKLCGSVTFLGYRNHDEMPALMKKADIFIMTSKGEGMPNVLLEAMASGMAVVSTSASSIGIIENGVNGFIADNVEEMSSTISEILNDTSLRRSIGRQARKTVLEKYSQQRMLQDYLELYKRIAQETTYAS